MQALIHIALVVCVSILLTAAEYTSYSRDNFGTFSKLFSPDNGPDDILSINDTINSYYTYPDYSVDRYLHVYEDDGVTVKPVVMHVERLLHSLYDPVARRYNYSAFSLAHQHTEETYYLTQSPAFPLNQSIESIKDWFYSLLNLKLKFTLMSLDLGGILGPVPFYWDVTVTYGFWTGGGEASYDIKALKRVSEPLKYGSLKTFTYLSIAITLLSVWSLWLSLWGVISNLRFFLATKTRYSGRFRRESGAVVPWESISLSVKWQFFNLWNITCAIGNILLIASCVISLSVSLSDSGVDEWNNVLFGVGSFFAWINLIRYLEYYERFYTLLRTVRFSLARVAGFMLSVTPIYLGYALLGIICFSQYTDLFVDLDIASVTIFSLINGDSILQAFNELEHQYPYPWVTRLYLYTLITFFVLSVLNIFIFLIEDAYQAAKADREVRDRPPEFGIRELFDVLEQEGVATGEDANDEPAEKALLEMNESRSPRLQVSTQSIEEALAENEHLMREEIRDVMERIQTKYAQRLRGLLVNSSPSDL